MGVFAGAQDTGDICHRVLGGAERQGTRGHRRESPTVRGRSAQWIEGEVFSRLGNDLQARKRAARRKSPPGSSISEQTWTDSAQENIEVKGCAICSWAISLPLALVPLRRRLSQGQVSTAFFLAQRAPTILRACALRSSGVRLAQRALPPSDWIVLRCSRTVRSFLTIFITEGRGCPKYNGAKHSLSRKY